MHFYKRSRRIAELRVLPPAETSKTLGIVILLFFLLSVPQMEGICKNNISHQPTRILIAKVQGWIELEVARQITGEADGGRVFAAALPIDLHAPGFVEIISVTRIASFLYPA